MDDCEVENTSDTALGIGIKNLESVELQNASCTLIVPG